MIALFHLYDVIMSGGTLTYTAHLQRSFKRIGVETEIYRIRPRSERTKRKFGAYKGLEYRNISPDDALNIAKDTPSILTSYPTEKALAFAPDILLRLAKHGMRVIMHDSRGYNSMPHFFDAAHKLRPLICIRESMQRQLPGSLFIPHPYVRKYEMKTFEEADADRPLHAISVARVTFAKRTHDLIEANRALSTRRKIVLRGGENRMYTRHVLLKRFPGEYDTSSMGFPLAWHAGAKECRQASFAVDFSIFPSDGGGSQYTFLEAWDAGAVNVLHADWFNHKGEMRTGKNCLAMNGPDELSFFLKRALYKEHAPIVEAGFRMLRKHEPVDVASVYKELVK